MKKVLNKEEIDLIEDFGRNTIDIILSAKSYKESVFQTYIYAEMMLEQEKYRKHNVEDVEDVEEIKYEDFDDELKNLWKR